MPYPIALLRACQTSLICIKIFYVYYFFCLTNVCILKCNKTQTRPWLCHCHRKIYHLYIAFGYLLYKRILCEKSQQYWHQTLLKIVYSSKVMEFPGKVFYRGISLSTFCPRSCRRWRWKLSPEIEDSLLIFVNFRYTRVLGAYSSSNSRHVVRARRALKFIVLFDRDSMRSCKWLRFCYWCCCYSLYQTSIFFWESSEFEWN